MSGFMVGDKIRHRPAKWEGVITEVGEEQLRVAIDKEQYLSLGFPYRPYLDEPSWWYTTSFVLIPPKED